MNFFQFPRLCLIVSSPPIKSCSIEASDCRNQRTCSVSFSLTKNLANDLSAALDYLNSLRKDLVFLPEDPFIVFPKEGKSSSQKKTGQLLSIENVVNSLSPAIKNVDLAGIWASGNIFIGYKFNR